MYYSRLLGITTELEPCISSARDEDACVLRALSVDLLERRPGRQKTALYIMGSSDNLIASYQRDNNFGCGTFITHVPQIDVP